MTFEFMTAKAPKIFDICRINCYQLTEFTSVNY